MKCSESWLRKWVNTNLTGEKLCHALTMAGLEVEQYAPVAADFSGIVIGEIVKIEKHPEIQRLHLCVVNIGKSALLKIVCGANNVKLGMKVPVAIPGAILANHKTIQSSHIHGFLSEGMLCSAKELGLSEEAEGLFELEASAPVGEVLRNYLNLDDYLIDISITPNRGDCLSVKGLAREISALTRTTLNEITISACEPTHQETLSIVVQDQIACPRYVGRVIREVKADAITPLWMKECLQRGGVRSISPIVDITNYVMLELGQPMHAFDLACINQGIIVRQSKQNEQISLLDGSEQTLDAQTLIIADHEKPLAIAGVMGGLTSSVTLNTKDIFLESAYFSPEVIARQRQFYNLSSESAYRFERTVDSAIQREAIERATQLILAIAGGEVGPVVDLVNEEALPKKKLVELSSTKIKQILGISIPKQTVNAIFNALRFSYEETTSNQAIENKEETIWCVAVPSFRPDITIREDLIEEIARLYGYENIPTHSLKAELSSHSSSHSQDLDFFRQIFCDNGYHEIISYSFIDKKLQSLFDPQNLPRELLNPMSTELAVMRTTLWPGLINTLLYNKSRQQARIRLFEIGTCFISQEKSLLQPLRLAG
ncbi:MAG: phenylalanine--tRNA ligase subunit beta [Gammaproteobacteria bacterium]|nr:phenylalanine--tRNA ligase subunit beta [Gammaproteobacteria bacterium]